MLIKQDCYRCELIAILQGQMAWRPRLLVCLFDIDCVWTNKDPSQKIIAVSGQCQLRPGHTGPDNENENENENDNDTNARPRLVEWAWAYSAWINSTNCERAFLSFSFSFSLSGPVWPGLYSPYGCRLGYLQSEAWPVKGTLWGNCKFPLEHFKDTKWTITPLASFRYWPY